MIEEWRPVVGWESLYLVSNQGHVRSLTRRVWMRNGHSRMQQGRPLRLGRSSNGYLSCSLTPPKRTHNVHTLVLAAFKGPRPDGLLGRHLDDDPDHNWSDNLDYGTYSDNLFDCVRNGHHADANKTSCKLEHPLAGANLYLPARGGRVCLACNRTRPTVRKLRLAGREVDFRAMADAKYAKIMGIAA